MAEQILKLSGKMRAIPIRKTIETEGKLVVVATYGNVAHTFLINNDMSVGELTDVLHERFGESPNELNIIDAALASPAVLSTCEEI